MGRYQKQWESLPEGFEPKTSNDGCQNVTEGLVMLRSKWSFLDRVVFRRVDTFYSHIPDSCNRSHDLF